MPPYTALSSCYDNFFEQDYLSKLRNKYLILLKKNGIKKGTVLDAGCGTGMLSMYLYENGYNVIGVDLSENMLFQARKKSLSANYNIRWYNCDISKSLPENNGFDAIVSSLDVVNHITDTKQVYSFFLNVYESLKKGGVFLFDINSYKKFSRQYAKRTYVYSSYHSVCVWKNNFDSETELCQMNIEVYSKDNKSYVKHTDFFYERYYSIESIKSLLKKAGFRSFDYNAVDKGTRYIIIAKKI